MKIGIDARLYGAAHRGLGRYTQKLIENLEKIDNHNQYFIYLQKDGLISYQPQNKNFQKVLADWRVYSWSEQIIFPRLLKKYNLDLMHFTHFNAPLFYREKFSVTIHDLIISHYPDSRATTINPLLYKIKLFFYQLVIKSAAKRAKKIIAVSNYTKNDIIKLFKISPNKIAVTYEGVDLPQDQRTDCRSVLAALDIAGDYLLYVGSAYPHKNLEKLIFAFQIIAQDKNNFQLVLVGRIDYFYQRLKNEIKNLDLQSKVIFTDYINDEQLACLYQRARAYVFPSLMEGFGLPPLEAQNYGLPVISSSASCLPEILGDSAIYFNPLNMQDMADKIKLILENKVLRNELVSKGIDNVSRYSWAQCAQETLNIFNQL